MKNILFSIITILILLVGCKNKTAYYQLGGIFDIDKNDKKILFSVSAGYYSSIYTIGTDGTELEELIPSSNNKSYSCPKYNSKGDKFLYLAIDTNNNSSIYVANVDGSGSELIISSRSYITEAVFSNFESKIYYCKANEFGHSSPLVRNAIHGFDLYSVDLNNKENKQVTNFNAYNLGRVSELNKDTLLMDMPDMENSGMVSISIEDPNQLKRFYPDNDPRGAPNQYHNACFNEKLNIIGLIAPYELYTMDKEHKKAKFLVRPGDNLVQNFIFFNQARKMLFSCDNEMSFYTINLDGTNQKKINVPFNNTKVN